MKAEKLKFVFPTLGKNDLWPEGHIIQSFGDNPGSYDHIGMKAHNGIDIVPINGYAEPVLAPHDGVVVSVSYSNDGSFQNSIYILSPEFQGFFYVSNLGHLTEQQAVENGQKVSAGDQVGFMGNSGFEVFEPVKVWGGINPDGMGTHLHWNIRKVRKRDDQDKFGIFENIGKEQYLTLDRDNGYGGNIDPLQLLK